MRRTLGADAGSIVQRGKLTASDGASGDEFGYSVAIYGATAVVGAYDKNSDTGAAYVFVASGSSWSQQAELSDPGDASGDEFGRSVAISGSTVVVGADGANSGTGAAYVFVRSGTTWSQQAQLTASDGAAGDLFGVSVAISGSTALVGAPFRASETGAAYVFVRSGSSWSQQAELTASGGASGDEFGFAVGVSASTAVVGAPFAASAAGAAYVFVRSGSAWSQEAKLTAVDGTAGDDFGFAVALHSSTVVVGAPGKDSFAGVAYVFAGAGMSWSQQTELSASDAASHDEFGHSVAIDARSVVIGAFGNNSYTGAAYVFARSGPSWQPEANLSASDAAANDSFGFAVAISGSTAIIGAPAKSSDTGAAYAFVLPSQQAELTASDGGTNNAFGDAVAISGSTAVVGAYGNNEFEGAAYVFVRSGTTWSLQAKLTASDGAPLDYFGVSVAISGSTVLVGSTAKNSGTGAAYVFVRSGTTWSQQAELTASDGTAGDDFGDAVALSGSTAIVCAYAKNDYTGAAYVFVRSGGSWPQQAELTAADGASGDQFGRSVALSGADVIIGAPDKTLLRGVAYVFTRSGSSWSEQAELTDPDSTPDDEFGSSVAISGTTALVGAPYDNSNTGAVYAYIGSGGSWSQRDKLTASDAAADDLFGWSLAIYGSTVMVGAYNNNVGAGAAYVFLNSGSSWSQQAELTASDADGGGDYFGWSVAISGSTAVVGAYGKNSNKGAAYAFGNV